jgi:hypothetical protein
VPVTSTTTFVVTNPSTVAVFNSVPVTSTPFFVVNPLLLPQLVFGGGWATQVTIANTSPVAQTVRVDFFSSTGEPLPLPAGSSLPSVEVPPGGVVVVSTEQ